MCVHVYVQYFRVYFLASMMFTVVSQCFDSSKRDHEIAFFSISKYSPWNLSKSQNVPERIPNSTEESHKLSSLNFTTFTDKWLLKRWIHTTQNFNIHFPTTIIKRNYIFLSCQLSVFWMQNCSSCFIGDPWYILLKYFQKFLLILLQFWLSLIYNKKFSFKRERSPICYVKGWKMSRLTNLT